MVDVAPPLQLDRSLVMVGLMGAGKSSIGRRLAQRLDLPFVDADAEIEAAAGCSIGEIFERYGEPYFRDGERRVIARLLDGPVQVVATGGGAFMDSETRARIRAKGISVWLKADVETLSERVSRRTNRPLLKSGDPKTVLTGLMERRYPIYAEADVIVTTDSSPPAATVEKVVAALADYLAQASAERGA